MTQHLPRRVAPVCSIGVPGRASQYPKVPPGLSDARVRWLLDLEPGNPHPESDDHQPAGRSRPRDIAGIRAPIPLVPLFLSPSGAR